MRDFWIEFGITTGISVLNVVISTKLKSPATMEAAQKALEALHEFYAAWQAEKFQTN